MGFIKQDAEMQERHKHQTSKKASIDRREPPKVGNSYENWVWGDLSMLRLTLPIIESVLA